MTTDVNISVEVAGVKMKNPLVLSEGPLTGSARLIERAAQHNIGAIVTKSIRQHPAQSPNPYMISSRGGLINADWTDIGFDAWLKELEELAIPMPLITNVATNYCPPSKAAELADVLQSYGASIVTFSDYEPENLVDAVRFARKAVTVPIMVKLPPFVKNIGELSKKLEDAGVDMIAAMDAVGPAMDIDISTGRPILGCDGAFGYYSSKPIFPLTLAYIAEIASNVSVPVLGVGGVSSAEDVIKLIMAGATCVGVVGSAILKGLGIFEKIESDLVDWMTKNGIKDIAEIRGSALQYIHPKERFDVRANIDQERCTGCTRCVNSCYAAAIDMHDKKARVNYEYCSGCGVCYTVCPAKAISMQQQ